MRPLFKNFFDVLHLSSVDGLLYGLIHKTKPALALVQKQLWKLNTGYVRIGDIGKSLVQYRLAATTQHRGRPINIIAIEELKSYLQQNDAVLLQE
ncbi:MAG: hypothetical protein ABI651_17280 [Verrucomicrobiota bacterium]